MDDLERRLLTLEIESRHERELRDFQIDALSRRLLVLETNPITASSLAKLAVALLLPIGVWLLTGDLRKALAALRMMGAG